MSAATRKERGRSDYEILLRNEAAERTAAQAHTHTHTHTYIYIYIIRPFRLSHYFLSYHPASALPYIILGRILLYLGVSELVHKKAVRSLRLQYLPKKSRLVFVCALEGGSKRMRDKLGW